MHSDLTSRPGRRRSAARPSLGALAETLAMLLLAAVLLAGCGGLGEDTGPPTAFGSGSGGPNVPQGTVQTVPLVNTLAETLGTVSYDDGYFDTALLPLVPSSQDHTMGVLSSSADGVLVLLSLIAGRPDTPCRFVAALSARDDGYTLLDDGVERVSDTGLEFHEVQLQRGDERLRLDCAELTTTQGVQAAFYATGDRLDTQQTAYLLNSITP